MRHERRPDARYRVTLRAAAEPSNPHEAALWRFLNQNEETSGIIRVVDIYEDVFEREVLQAWIIAGATDEVIEQRLGTPPEVVTAYRHLCCNIGAFRDRLELLRWVRIYEGTREGKLLLERAVHADGVEAVAHLCGFESALDPNRVNEQVMREAYFRGVGTLRGSGLSSTDAAAAHQLLKTATATAAAAQKRGAPNVGDTLLKLKHREMTYQAEDIVPRGEILH